MKYKQAMVEKRNLTKLIIKLNTNAIFARQETERLCAKIDALKSSHPLDLAKAEGMSTDSNEKYHKTSST